jgi:5-methylcytosine-specific restriction endonuclease McrA
MGRGLSDPLQKRCRAALASLKRRAAADGRRLPFDLDALVKLARACPTCGYCKNCCPSNLLTFDHKLPVARGGRHDLDNHAVCCIPCNLRKGLLSAEEYVQLLALLQTFHPRAAGDVRGRLAAGGRRYARK